MPGGSRGHRAEVKYNVVLEYPQLGLHAAAATGNIALVRYALDHGQPINSALDGVLPLHAACSGGSDLVVRLLIERGADVNAPRLPRRYSNDKGRDASAPIVGASGSTPLHFACANGHANVVMTLLLHGAHPDRSDKHGTTPEVLAREKGWMSCADILREWTLNKDKDLRDRELSLPSQRLSDEECGASKQKDSHGYCGSLDCPHCATRKRIRVKRSIDNALHMLKPAATHTHSYSSSTSVDRQPPSPVGKALGEYTFYPSTDMNDPPEYSTRRPSLPQLPDVPQHPSSFSHRRPSQSQSFASSSSRRPRSAGTDAESSHSSQRVKGKISLLNIFKKNSVDVYGTPDSLSGSSSVFTSGTPSPALDSRSILTGPSSTPQGCVDVMAGSSTDSSPLNAARFQNREGGRQSPSQAVELHHPLSRESLRGQYAGNLTAEPVQLAQSRSARPSILRAHGRSSSSGQSTSQQMQSQSDSLRPLNSVSPPSTQSVRSLRFNSPPNSRHTTDRLDRQHHSRSPGRRIRGSESKASLRSRSPESLRPIQMEYEEQLLPQMSLSAAFNPDTTSPLPRNANIEEEEEEEYGDPIEPYVGMSELTLEEGTLHASPEMSPSELPDPHAHEGQRPDAPSRVFECPFSINRPPVANDEDPQEPLTRPNLLGIDGIDGRMRGDSVSSMNTNPTSSSSASAYLSTPAISTSHLPTPAIYSPTPHVSDLPSPLEGEEALPQSAAQSPKRPRVPLDIDIRSISSHAQAEALVQQAQQRILNLKNELDSSGVNPVGMTLGEGRTPLSARLAALGESLAIERKFKEEEGRQRSPLTTPGGPLAMSPLESNGGFARSGTLKSSRSARGLDRTFSLEEKTRIHGRHGRVQKVRRPHTSGGTTTSGLSESLAPPERFTGHQHSVSSGAVIETTPDTTGKPVQKSPTPIVSITPPPPAAYEASLPEPEHMSLDYRPRPVRSRTPEPRIDTGTSYLRGGVPLSRYPTSPANDSLYSPIVENTLTKQEREAARANKLAKMGFSSSTEIWHGSSTPSSVKSQKRFGIKNLVQTLTGRP